MPQDGWVWFVAIIGALLTVLNITDKFISLKKVASEPQRGLEARVSEIEKRLHQHDEYFSNDKLRIDAIEKEFKMSNTIVIKSLQALTEHSLDGNNDDQLRECAKEMNNYLINR